MNRRSGGRRRVFAAATAMGLVALAVPAGVAFGGGAAYADAASRANAETGTVSGLTTQSATSVAFSPDGSRALVAGIIDVAPGGIISEVDTATGAVTSTVAGVTGGFPDSILYAPTGSTALVASSDSQVMVIDVVRHEQSNTLNDYSGSNPVGMAATADGATAIIANSGNNTLSVVDMGTLAEVGVADFTGNEPWGAAISPDGNTALVTNRGDNTVALLEWNETDLTFIQEATLSGFDDPVAVQFSADGGTAYVVNSGIRTSTDGSIAVVDVATRALEGTVGGYAGRNPMDIALTPEGDTAYVADYGSNSISVIDTTTNTQVDTVAGFSGIQPISIAIAPGGSTAYVANMGDTTTQPAGPGSVSIIDITDPPTPPGPPVITDVSPNGGQLTAVFTPGAAGTLPTAGYTMNVYDIGETTPVASSSGAGSPLIVQGLINGTAYTVEIVANNPAGDVPSARFGPVTAGIAPFFTASTPPTARVGVDYSYTFLASGLPVPTVSLHTALPDGLTFTPGAQPGSGTISGRPTGRELVGGADLVVDLDIRATSVVSVTSITVPFRLTAAGLGEEPEPTAAPTPTTTPTPSVGAGAGSRDLAATGGDTPLSAIAVGAGLLAAGGILVGSRIARRRSAARR